MRRSWFKETFGWIGDDFRHLVTQLQRSEIWILIGIAVIFGVITYYSVQLALQLDFTMRLRHLTEAACREIGNGATALLFFGTMFFALTITMVFGEFARHLDYKRRQAYAHARSAAWQCAGWGAFALTTGLAMVFFLQSQCLSM